MRLDEAIAQAVTKGTKKWSAIKKQEERNAEAAARSRARWQRGYSDRVNATDVAAKIIPEAYAMAAGSQGLAHARQIYYAARQAFLDQTGRPMDSVYFTQGLLPDFVRDNPDVTASWDVVYDARGHFREPHTKKKIGIGTLEVRRYLKGMKDAVDADVEIPEISNDFPTSGPANRYGAVLVIEKEGFDPLLEHAGFQERYDLAIMSGKGMGTVALRTLVEELNQDVKILVLHDFDVAGFSIAGTLSRDTRRYQFGSAVEVIDIGLRLGDVDGLPTEDVVMKGDQSNRLRENGATEQEIAFMFGQCIDPYRNKYKGRRVELNALTSDQFVAFLDKKLKHHKIGKVIPDEETLEQAFRRAAAVRKYREALEEAEGEIRDQVKALVIPKNLAKRIKKRLATSPAIPWDEALEDEVNAIEFED